VKAFFSSLFAELAARRARRREALGDRGQALLEFLVLNGLVFGSAGLFLRPWMLAAAPWGLAVPIVFLMGHTILEVRRQRRAASAAETPKPSQWLALSWSLACSAAGAGAFIMAFNAAPAPAPEAPAWEPPADAVPVDLG